MSRCAVCDGPTSCGLALPGTEGSFASTSDDPSFAIGTATMDLEIFVHSLPDGEDFVLGSQWEEPDNRAWLFVIRGDGHLSFRASADGVATTVNAISTIPIPPVPRGLRVEFQPNNGSGGWTATFFTSSVTFLSWIQLGAVVIGTPNMSVFDSSAPVVIGAAG